jgi:6-pyruvoyltetrahydropterin/6-carboxytetrahydropterin synthase
MKMPFWKVVAEFRFDSAHAITNYAGGCGRTHGHTYHVRMELTAERLRSSEHCDREIMVADFKTLKWAKKDFDAGGLDHAYLNDIQSLGGDATAERVAQYIYRETMRRVRSGLLDGDDGADLRLKVTVHETPDSSCEYWE